MKISIRTKLLLAFALIIVLSSIVNIYSLIQMDVLAGISTKIYNHPLQVTRAVLTANTGIIKMHRSMKDVVLATNAAEIKAAQAQVDQYEQKVYQQFAIVQKWILGKEGAALIAETIQTFRNWAPIREKVIALMKSGQRDQAAVIHKGKVAQHIALLEIKMAELKNYAANKATSMYVHAQATRSTVLKTTFIALITVLVLGTLLSLFISSRIIESVRIINALARKLVAGEITSAVNDKLDEKKKIIAYRDEMGEIGRDFYAVTESFSTVINDIVEMSQGLAAGRRVTVQAKYQGDLLHIKDALEMASFTLAKARKQNAAQNWLKTGEMRLNDLMRGEQEIVTLAKAVVSFLSTYTEAELGLFYQVQKKAVGDEQKAQNDRAYFYLQLIASYAYTNSDNRPDHFEFGEGLVGQTALERKTLFRTYTQAEYAKIIQSGLVTAVPRHVVIIPFLYEGTVKGVIEFGFSETPTRLHLDFLEQVMLSIGIAVNSAESRAKMQVFLNSCSNSF